MRSYKKLIFPLFTLLNLAASSAMAEENPLQQTRQRPYDATLETSEDKGGFDEQEETGSSVKKPRRNPTDLSSVESYELSPCLSGMPREILSDILNYVFEDMNNNDVGIMRGVCREFSNIILSLAQVCPDYKGRPALIANKNVERFVQLTQIVRNTDNKNSSEEIAIAYFCLGDMYLRGTFKNPNYQKALKYYNKSHKRGFYAALLRKGLMYEEGLGVLKDKIAAQFHYINADCRVSKEALCRLACMYARKHKFLQDYSKALELLEKAAEQDDSKAQNELGIMYEEGKGVEQNGSIAANWYHKAADQGNSCAQYNLGRMYEIGRRIEKDYAIAAHWYHKAAEQGNSSAQYNLGRMYEIGSGFEKDHAMAVQWYQKAAAQGNGDAQLHLGSMYYDGDGVERNFSIASHWYTRAAHQGYINAQFILALMYEEGMGVEKDYATAAYWYKQAAEQGDVESQYKLGIMYEEGRGVEKNDSIAAQWYQKAAGQDHLEAQFK